jgi:hypothetical protein
MVPADIVTNMRLRRSVQNQCNGDQKNMSQERSGLATKEGRMKVYSCVFCEFIQSNLADIAENVDNGTFTDPAFEAKYLYHLRTVHALER